MFKTGKQTLWNCRTISSRWEMLSIHVGLKVLFVDFMIFFCDSSLNMMSNLVWLHVWCTYVQSEFTVWYLIWLFMSVCHCSLTCLASALQFYCICMPAAIIENLIMRSDFIFIRPSLSPCLLPPSVLSFPHLSPFSAWFLHSSYFPLLSWHLLLPALLITAGQAGNRLSPVLSGHRRHRLSAVWLQHGSHQRSRAGWWLVGDINI